MSYARNQALIEDMNYANDHRVRAQGWPGGFDQDRMAIVADLDRYMTLQEAHRLGLLEKPTLGAYMDVVCGPEPEGYDPESLYYVWDQERQERVSRPRGPWRNEAKLDFDVVDGAMVYLFTDVPTSLPATFEVCGTCDGKGIHVNPSIDCCGLTREDFDYDPDFEESYRSGAYDQTCNQCHGKRVEPVVDRKAADRQGLRWALELIDDLAQCRAEMHAERMAEMRMGC